MEDNQPDRELGFWAATVSLGFKLCTSENEHPLLCEGVRRQKGELALKLLVRFKDDPSTLGTILEKLLDKIAFCDFLHFSFGQTLHFCLKMIILKLPIIMLTVLSNNFENIY